MAGKPHGARYTRVWIPAFAGMTVICIKHLKGEGELKDPGVRGCEFDINLRLVYIGSHPIRGLTETLTIENIPKES